jgi:hypothetical protein
MAMTIKEFEMGPCILGSGMGSPIFSLKFNYDDKVLDGDNPEAENAKLVLDDITARIKENGWEQQWKIFLLGKMHGIGLYIIGDDVAEEAHRSAFAHFFRLLSHISAEAQKMFAIQKISEPYVVYVGTPQNFTSLDDFYNNFNHIFIECPLSDNYSQIAFMEQRNHVFARFNFTVEKSEDFALIDKYYRDLHLLDMAPQKIQITAAKEVWKEAVDYAMRNAYRLYPKTDDSWEGFVGKL